MPAVGGGGKSHRVCLPLPMCAGCPYPGVNRAFPTFPNVNGILPVSLGHYVIVQELYEVCRWYRFSVCVCVKILHNITLMQPWGAECTICSLIQSGCQGIGLSCREFMEVGREEKKKQNLLLARNGLDWCLAMFEELKSRWQISQFLFIEHRSKDDERWCSGGQWAFVSLSPALQRE
jgi:hypothetical protein